MSLCSREITVYILASDIWILETKGAVWSIEKKKIYIYIYIIPKHYVNSYQTICRNKAWTSPSYKDCREIVEETRNMELSLKKASKKKEVLEKELCLKLKGQPPLNRQNFEMNSKSE